MIDRFRYACNRVVTSSRLSEAVLLSITFLLIIRSVTFGFILGDDYANVLGNEHMLSPELNDVLLYWILPYQYLYIPCTYTLWLMESWLSSLFPNDGWPGSLNPAIFHFGNVVLYLTCVSLVFRFLRRISGHTGAAFIGSLLFALHPLHVESIAWITETKNLLAGVFAGLCLNFYPFEAASDSNRVFRSQRTRYVLACLFFIMSMLSKPSAVTLPLVLIVLDTLVFGRQWRSAILKSVPLVVAALFISVLTASIQSGQTQSAVSLGPLAKIQLTTDVVWFYTTKAVLPLGIASDYGRSAEIDDTLLLSACKIVLTVGILFILAWPGGSSGIAGAASYLILLLPVSGMVTGIFSGVSTVADRHAFLPLLGFAIMATAIMKSRWRVPELIVATTILATFFVISNREMTFWEDDRSHFERAIARNPESWQSHALLGSVALQAEDWELAEFHSQYALELVPDWQEVRFQLAIALLNQGRYEDALAEARMALQIDPQNRGFLRQVCWMLATVPDADLRAPEEALLLSARISNDSNTLYAEDYDTLSVVYAAVGRFDEAVALAEMARDGYLARGESELATAAEGRLQLFQQKREFIDEIPIAP